MRTGVALAEHDILNDYLMAAKREAVYEKLEDGTFVGRIPSCQGVIAFGVSLSECESELRSTLEDWVQLGIRLGHPMGHKLA